MIGITPIQFYTRICALVLAVAQAIGIVVSFSGYINTSILNMPTWVIGAGIVLMCLVHHTFFFL